jgi:serine protease AprX
MRHDVNRGGEVRSSALWGKRSGARSSALWGKGGRGFVAVVALAMVFMAPTAGFAGSGSTSSGTDSGTAVVPNSLLSKAKSNPKKSFRVIVQGRPGRSSSDVAAAAKGLGGSVKRQFRSVNGAAVSLPGSALVNLSRNSKVLAITPDAPVQAAEYEDSEMWRQSSQVDSLWGALNPLTGQLVAPQAPAIAIVDSGVDATRVDSFGSRLVAQVNLSSLSPRATGDDEGHGTMVAGVAAGADPAIPGVAQNAPIVSVRTANAEGESLTSDVIAAADWVKANAKLYNIRVVNFSLGGGSTTSFRYDPLDRAVEALWLRGIVVVASAGNHGVAGSSVDMSYAPANDPFVITVGAVDQHQTSDPQDDTRTPWSAYGHTLDGFMKPEIMAPGRFMIMPVPEDASIPQTVPDRVFAPGYMWMSGTSFAAPVVSGAAAQLLARHPSWTPDQVKGALMLTSVYLGLEGGTGELDAQAASLVSNPPNPNEHLNDFVKSDPLTGAKVFDQASWANAVASDASWASASWASASWANASWASASWASASWASASWAQNVTSMMSAASWSEASWSE